MNLIEFTKIISDPASISKRQTKGLDQILEDYPYFQAAHFLRLYALKKQRSFRYNDALKKTAAYTTDRELLFNYITNFDFDILAKSETSNEVVQPTDEISPPESSDVSTEESAIKPIAESETATQEQKPESPESTAAERSKAEKSLGIGQPLNFEKDESYSFGEWLQLSQLKPIDRSGSKKKPPKISRSNLDLINDFIAKQPKMRPVEEETYNDLAQESSTENEQLMTETLAHVYLEQKKYDKAIAAFTVLSLKYPEKSSFFADRIEAVRKLQKS